LYVYAINLAQKAKLDVQSQNVIYRRYADHLYQKGDYDAAMQQYLKAIESTEPSQVIRKYLDTQRIHNLIEYLEELHEHHQATADHTTLLLNCYAKLKDIDKLERFIKSPGDLKFDLDTAISMCRQGGYFDQAAYLATKHGEHEIVVDILIEDSRKYREALDYIWRLDAESMYPNMMKYARVLLEHQPKETTQLFIDYYTDNYAPKPEVGTELTNGHTAPEQGYALSAANAVQNLTNLLPLPYMNTSALPTSTTAQAQTKPTVGDVTISADEPTVKPPSYVTPKPRTAFSSFVDHPDQFIAFLEVLIKANNLEEQDRTDLYTTLFEMYLHKASTCTSDDKKEEFQNKAKGLITARDTPLDPSNVLLLSHLSNFTTGSLLVKERAGLVEDIFRSYTAAKDTKGAIKALHKYGPQKPSLYSAALRYFTSDERVLQEAGDELAAVLQKIDNESLMAPLQVIQTLAASGVATIGLVKEYLQNTIDRERKEIEQNQRVIESYRSETESKRKEMDELASKPAVFQATRCSACGGGLELPAVHFLCKHSFHQRCLNPIREAGDDEDKWECPLCKGSNETIRAIRRMQDESADKHDLFKEELKRGGPGGGWRVVGEWFGRGVMKSQVAE
jgi:tetratricopeptide (TPR) repeat protein